MQFNRRVAKGIEDNFDDSPAKSNDKAFWTNPSVVALAEGKDPIEVIVQKARDLVFKAIEDGWQGPPFDPFWLAKYRRLSIAPRDDIPDARLVSDTSSDAKIEFNPNQPRARVRFSLAHEIGHTLFPDFAATIRNRIRPSYVHSDEWQLELLCNIAAAEILMPPSPALNLGAREVTIENLMRLWKEFDVSPEALLLKIVKLTSHPLSVFSVSNINDSRDSDFRLDYCIPSSSSNIRLSSGVRIPMGSVLSECTAIGFTAKGTAHWGRNKDLEIECVGIPPYPGRVYPRIIGIIRYKSEKQVQPMDIRFIYGDITEPRGQGRRIIAHIVNDRTPNWGAGAARAIATKWPAVGEDFCNWATIERNNFKLGHIRETRISQDLTVVNMVAQHGYGPSRKPRIRYHSLAQCLSELGELAIRTRASVHMPRIGTGFAGGNWAVIEELIRENLISKGIEVVVYQLPTVQKTRGQMFLDNFALVTSNSM